MSGIVYLVGAGPGAVDLLTLRAARLLAEADIVLHDALVPEAILSLVSRGEKVAVGKRSGRHSTAQHFINKRLLDAARQHGIVVRLKGGDPMLFGRAHEEIEFLEQHQIRVKVVPGITAALAASADLRISLTQRGKSRSVVFVTPRVADGARASSWIKAVIAADTAAIYMGAGEAAAISSALISAGKPGSTPVTVIENASLPEANWRSGTLKYLADIAPCGAAPGLILIGAVYANQRGLAAPRSASQAA